MFLGISRYFEVFFSPRLLNPDSDREEILDGNSGLDLLRWV